MLIFLKLVFIYLLTVIGQAEAQGQAEIYQSNYKNLS